jgi:hypothetical protein
MGYAGDRRRVADPAASEVTWITSLLSMIFAPVCAVTSALSLSTEVVQEASPSHEKLNWYPVGLDAATAVMEMASGPMDRTRSEAIPDFPFRGMRAGPVTFTSQVLSLHELSAVPSAAWCGVGADDVTGGFEVRAAGEAPAGPLLLSPDAQPASAKVATPTRTTGVTGRIPADERVMMGSLVRLLRV